MNAREVQYSLLQLEHALARLKLAIDAAGADELKQDGTIQRFEFTFELLWKTLKRYLHFLGQMTNNPRDTLKAAFREGLLTDETIFLAMLDDRNLCTHAYDLTTTRLIFQQITQHYYAAMAQVLAQLRQRLTSPSPPTGRT